MNVQPRVVRVEQVLLRPRLERKNHRKQLHAGMGQPVLIPVGFGAVADSLQQAVLDQSREAVGQDVAADAEVR